MTRLIRESAACPVRYTVLEKGKLLLDFTSGRASFEYDWEQIK